MVVFDRANSEKLNHNTSKANSGLKEATKRLASGYRVNSAADDAAGLAISEKLRSIDRGLRRGLRNITEGINFLDTVDGASQGIHDMLHRLEELAVQSANGTYDRIDRDAMDMEYQQLLDEINQFTQSSEFNTMPLFDQHCAEYEIKTGNVVHNEAIVINPTNDTLIFGYTLDGKSEEYTISLPHGKFRADELADLVDTELYDKAPNLIIGVNSENQFIIQAEPGTVEYISGSGSELFYDAHIGCNDGYLLGVTHFENETVRMEVKAGQNDVFSFRYGNADDTLYTITLQEGNYTHSDLIDEINRQFRANPNIPAEIEAVPQYNEDGRRIVGIKGKLAITGLSGNFLKIETQPPYYHSPLYDIRLDNDVDNTQAIFNGVKTLSGNIKVERGRNEFFVFDFSYYDEDGNAAQKTVRFDLLEDGVYEKDYSSAMLAEKIQKGIEDSDIPFKAEIKNGMVYITSDQYGRKCSVKLNKTNVPSGHMVNDFFDTAALRNLTPSPSRSAYNKAYFYSYQNLRNQNTFIPNGKNELVFKVTHTGGTTSITHSFTPDRVYSATEILDELNNELTNYPSLSDKVEFTINANGGITLSASDNEGGTEIEKIEATGTAYSTLLNGNTFYDNKVIAAGHSDSYIISQSPNMPSGANTVSTQDGYTVENNITYGTGNNSSSVQTSQDYINYNPVVPSIQDGSVEEITQGSIGSPVNAQPAKLTLNNVLSQFTAAGHSIRDINLSFKLSDECGSITNYSINIPKNSTSTQAMDIIKNTLDGVASVQQLNNGTVYIESLAKGNFVKFTDVNGNLLNSATKSSLASSGGSVVDEANNKVYVPAKLSLGSASTNIPYKVEGGKNDTLILNYGGTKHTVTFQNGKEYTSLNAMAADIANALSGTGITVSQSGGSIVFVGDPKTSGGISVDNSSTCTLNKRKVVDTSVPPGTKFPGSLTVASSCVSSKVPLTVKAGVNDTITLNYSAPGSAAQTLTIKVAEGVYGSNSSIRTAIISAINSDSNLRDKITVDTSDSGIKFVTKEAGDGYKLGNIGGSMGINLYEKHAPSSDANGVGGSVSNGTISFPSYIKNNKFSTVFSGGSVNINSSNNRVHFVIDGFEIDFTLADGDYSSDALKNKLAQEITNKTGTISVSVSGGALTIKGAVGASGAVQVYGDDNSPYFKGANSSSSPTSRRILDVRCRINGQIEVNISHPVDLSYFNKMSFDYTDKSGTTHVINVSVPQKIYNDASELANEIQSSIDGVIGAGNLKVDVFQNGKLVISGAKTSNDVIIGNFKGGLFDRVFQRADYTKYKEHKDGQGTTDADNASCIIGRNTLQPVTAEEIASGKNVLIYRGLNDTLIFDFNFDSDKYKVEFKIPEGAYTPEELASAIEAEGRVALASINRVGTQINPEFFHATIGLAPIGLSYGDNLTAFTNSDKLVLSYVVEDNGEVHTNNAVIDGIRGNSAYRVFYDSTGQPSPSTIIGNADLSEGLVIKQGVNDTLIIDLDDESVEINFPQGYYTIEELADKINEVCESKNSIVRAVDQEGKMMFYTIENGDYHFKKFSGNAAEDIFYGGTGRTEDENIGIHTGRRTDSYIWYDKARISKELMRINTTGITTAERALKALDRLNGAVNILTMCRTKTGAYKNRSEMTFERNTILSQNLVEAESGIRDADIPNETGNLAKHQINLQIQTYLAQMDKENQQSVLNLLG